MGRKRGVGKAWERVGNSMESAVDSSVAGDSRRRSTFVHATTPGRSMANNQELHWKEGTFKTIEGEGEISMRSKNIL